MKFRPNQVWWLGIGLFAPSIFTWIFVLSIFIYKGDFYCPFDWNGIVNVYLPLFAAILGFTMPLLCLRLFKLASWRLNLRLFLCYVAVFLAWGIIDIRYQHYQMGGHTYPHSVYEDGHKYYSHSYFTWYFMPYRLIEGSTIESIPD
jgi:hypothetical protein